MTQTRRGFFKGAIATALASQALTSPLPGLAENSQEQRTKARALSTAGDAPVGGTSQAAGKNYEATWESLAKRPTPAWFPDAKFGIFVQWGPYSVPAYNPKKGYAEWIGNPKNGWVNDPFVREMFGDQVTYWDFGKLLKAELFNPDQWADLFARAGAKYVVFSTKFHDGFCMWPTTYSWPKDWNAGATGPKRDVVGDIQKAVRQKGMRFGAYFSLCEWFNPLEMDNSADLKHCVDGLAYSEKYMTPQVKELVTQYKPDILWGDGNWVPSDQLKVKELLAWVYYESPIRDKVVVNDRWGDLWTERNVGDYAVGEYGHFWAGLKANKPWEEGRGIGKSFGYNRVEDVDDYKSSKELVHLLVEVVSKGGNLALDVGPTGDGRIPVIMQQRLVDIGRWLEVNGEAIYRTRRLESSPPEQEERKNKEEGYQVKLDYNGTGVRYTAMEATLYAICLDWPGKELVLKDTLPESGAVITMLGCSDSIQWRIQGADLHITVPQLSIDKLPCLHAWTFRIPGAARGIKSPAAI
jgi:alpha-L-fucosidase